MWARSQRPPSTHPTHTPARPLQFASPSLRRNVEVVTAAARNEGQAVQFAAAELQADKGVALAAVASNGGALQ